MKRVLLACFLVFATCAVVSVSHTSAYAVPPAVTTSSFMTKVNTMDAQIGAGDMVGAQATWESIHTDMLAVLGTSKANIQGATTPADAATYKSILNNQRTIYWDIWNMHTNLTANRAAIHTRLTDFSATI